MTSTRVIDLNTAEGCVAYVRTFTVDQLIALADAPVTMANLLVGAAAEGELIVRGVR